MKINLNVALILYRGKRNGDQKDHCFVSIFISYRLSILQGRSFEDSMREYDRRSDYI